MESWELAAREAIRDTIARYTWCGDFGDAEGFAALFAEDGVLEVKGGPTYRGRDEIRDMVKAIEESTPRRADGRPAALKHHVSSVRIELEGREGGRAFAYFVVLGPDGPDHWGRYSDVLVSRPGRWLFQSRRVSVDGQATTSRLSRSSN